RGLAAEDRAVVVGAEERVEPCVLGGGGERPPLLPLDPFLAFEHQADLHPAKGRTSASLDNMPRARDPWSWAAPRPSGLRLLVPNPDCALGSPPARARRRGPERPPRLNRRGPNFHTIDEAVGALSR